MKKRSASQDGFLNFRLLLGFVLSSLGVALALLAFSVNSSPSVSAAGAKQTPGVVSGTSYHNDVSPALRDQPAWPMEARQNHEAPENPLIPTNHKDMPDTVVQDRNVSALALLAPSIPAPIMQFAGIPFPGVSCSCAPPDTNGEVGTTQYVQMVNTGYQVFDKVTGGSLLGPNSIESIWSGFGGVCQTSGFGDPVVVFDQIASRWVITEFAGTSIPTDYCVAVSTTDDATGTFNRYAFHLGSNFIDYPKIAVWPDAYYVSFNIFNSSGTAFLGPQPVAFDRTNMLAGNPATFVAMPILGSSHSPILPSDQDGRKKAGRGAPNTYVEFPGAGNYIVSHFHVDFAIPTNSTFTTFATIPAAPFTLICPGNRACVPQKGSTEKVDAIGDRLMFRLAYRKFRDHESLVGNYTVSVGGIAAIRWFEMRGVTAGPVTLFQESTYAPGDGIWRWMGSIAMDRFGNMALGFSASSSTIFPQIRYVGRLSTDPINTLTGEQHLFDGTGSQASFTFNRWGDYSDMTVDPVDESTFWYTQEYYETTSSFNWRTRIGDFKF